MEEKTREVIEKLKKIQELIRETLVIVEPTVKKDDGNGKGFKLCACGRRTQGDTCWYCGRGL